MACLRHRFLRLAALFVLLGWCGAASAVNVDFGDIRALWISRFDYGPYTEGYINTIIDDAAAMGFTDIVWQVRGRADGFYDGSIYEPKATAVGSLDALQVAIDRTHSHGMKLHAWTNTLPLWNLPNPPSSATVQNPSLHPFNAVSNPTAANPGFRVIDKFGNPEPADGWSTYSLFNPASPAAHDHINNVLRDIATRYDVDGIHMDYTRYAVNQSVSGETPFNRLPHDDLTHQMYSAWAQQQYPTQPSRWNGSNFANAAFYREFIMGRITDLVGSIKDTIDSVEVETGRQIDLSAAVWRNPNIGKADYLQDYRTWLERDYLDMAMPMMYLSASNDHLMQTDLAAVMNIETNAKIVPGIGVYLHTPANGGVDLTITQLQRVYDWGANGAIFYHSPSFFNDCTGGPPSCPNFGLAPARREAVTEWYENLPPPLPPLNPGPGNVIDDFEVDNGHFGWPYNHSPSSQTFGLTGATTIGRVTSEAQAGVGSQRLSLVSDGSANWQLRHNSGMPPHVADPAGNVPLEANGWVGFWLKTDTPGITVRIGIDDPTPGNLATLERGVPLNVIADNQWHLYQWNFEDPSHWIAFAGGANGIIDGVSGFVTIDSIWFAGAGDAVIYLDTVSHHAFGALTAAHISGDYNGDGVVDMADYLILRKEGRPPSQFEQWRANFGNSAGAGGSALTGTAAVPEPAGLLILLAGALSLWVAGRRRAA